jgi:hypothetical protein
VEDKEMQVRFTYHAPKGEQPQKYEDLRAKAKELAVLVMRLTPESREQSLAITKIEEAVMWANAAVARREKIESTTSG